MKRYDDKRIIEAPSRWKTLCRVVMLSRVGVALSCLGLFFGPFSIVPGHAEDAVGLARCKQLADEWLSLRREIGQTRGEWQKEQELLQSEVAMLRELHEQHVVRLAEQEAALRDVEETMRALGRDSSQDGDNMERLKAAVVAGEACLQRWQTRLPAFLAESLHGEFSRLAMESGADSGLGERLQRVVNLNTQLQLLTRAVNVGSLVLTTPAGDQQQMDVVFWGLAVGYAVAPDASLAAVAYPDKSGWQWTWRPDLAVGIRNVLASYRKDQPAVFVPLPVRVEREVP